MKKIEEILRELDQLFEAHKIEEVEAYLENALREAKEQGEYEAVITIVNEMIGFYRDTSQYEKALDYCNQILPFMEQLGLKGTIHYATTCLNVANACRAAGEWQASLKFYEEALKIYHQILPEGHELYASYYNNLSLLYQEMGEFHKAAAALKQALSIIEPYHDNIKIATTCSNLASSLLRVERLEEAEEYLERSLRIYREEGEKDFHYGAALSAMGELQYRKNDYSRSHQYYMKALQELEKHVGKTEYYNRTLENIRMVERRMKDEKTLFSFGMKQCLDFYYEYGKSRLEKKFPLFLDKMAIAVTGEGSHCFGYDDAFSMDHDFYPGFSIFVTKDTYEKIGSYLEAEYARLEEKAVGNYQNKSISSKSRTGVCIIEDFYKNILGNHGIPESEEDWLGVREELLATATNGVVLEDPEGIFSEYRNRLLAYYPRQVWLRRLAQQLYHLSQYGQYNYGRMLKRGDKVTASQCRSFFIDSAMKMVYLLNRVYTPYYKWQYRGMEQLECFGVKEKLEALSSIPIDHKEENLELIENICICFLRQLEKRELIERREKDTYLAHYIDQILSEEKQTSLASLVDQLVMIEWKALDSVENEGGRADCQDDWATFSIMRKSQYLTWTPEMLKSYINDFYDAQERGWNLITEKYGRMMEFTAVDTFNRIKEHFPPLPGEKKRILDEIIKIQVSWMEEFARKYPYMAENCRAIHTYEDTQSVTSFETYLRGELATYSDRTLDLYGRFIVSYMRQEKNLTVDIMTNTALLYGYQGLDEAEKLLAKSLSG